MVFLYGSTKEEFFREEGMPEGGWDLLVGEGVRALCRFDWVLERRWFEWLEIVLYWICWPSLLWLF